MDALTTGDDAERLRCLGFFERRGRERRRAVEEREWEEREMNAAEDSGGEERRRWRCCDCATAEDEALDAIVIRCSQFTPKWRECICFG